MVPKPPHVVVFLTLRFRAVLFRMVPKLGKDKRKADMSFRAVLFRMVPKL